MLITLKNVKKIVGGEILFEQLNFELQPGEKVGLVGRNGTGKTTIFKLIQQLEPIDGGQLFIKKQAKIGYLAQIPIGIKGSIREYLQSSFQELLSIQSKMNQLEADMQDESRMERAIEEYGKLQDQYMRMGGYEMDSQIERVAHGLGINELLSAPFHTLSGGEKTKVGLAGILLEKPDVLLLDEPTNHLDLQAIEWLEEYIQQYEGAVCIISHDRYFLDETVKKIYDLEHGEINIYYGNFSSYVKEKEERLLAEFKAYQEQQKKIKKMKEAIKRLREWANQANPPNEKLYKRARNMERALERMEKLDKPMLDPKKMDLSFDSEDRSGKDVLVAENVHKSFNGNEILKGVNLHVRYQERLAILGRNGSGKSTLLNLLLGTQEPSSGEIKIGSQVTFGYLRQQPLVGVDENIRLIDFFREKIRVTEGQARHILARFMFFGYAVFRKIGQLSGGEQMRLQLAIFMHQGINVLILDEPTNHLDIDSQEVLEEAIDHFNGTIVCVSHDRYFLNRCFKDTAYMEDGKLYRFPGNYAETRSKWLEQVQKTQEEQPKKQSSKGKKEKTSTIKQEDSPKVEEEIEQLEAELKTTQEKMEVEKDLDRLVDLQGEKEQLESKLEVLYEEWLMN